MFQVLNKKEQSGKFNFTKQFPHYKEVLYRPDLKGRQLGKKVVFDMDMSAGDFLALFYLLKIPVEVVDLKVNPSLCPSLFLFLSPLVVSTKHIICM